MELTVALLKKQTNNDAFNNLNPGSSPAVFVHNFSV